VLQHWISSTLGDLSIPRLCLAWPHRALLSHEDQKIMAPATKRQGVSRATVTHISSAHVTNHSQQHLGHHKRRRRSRRRLSATSRSQTMLPKIPRLTILKASKLVSTMILTSGLFPVHATHSFYQVPRQAASPSRIKSDNLHQSNDEPLIDPATKTEEWIRAFRGVIDEKEKDMLRRLRDRRIAMYVLP
jgi:hypothetical protein